MQTEYWKRLRNANIIVLLMFVSVFLTRFFTRLNLEEVFLLEINSPIISTLQDYSIYIFLSQLFALNISSLVVTIGFARRTDAISFRFPKHIPFMLVLVQIVLELIIPLLTVRWISLHYPQRPPENFTYWITWLIYFTSFEFVLSNFVIAFALHKSDLSIKLLRISLWILTPVVLGMVFNMVRTLLEGIYAFALPEEQLAEFVGLN